jgi:erythritol transport system ATP-binding protein
VSRPAEDVILEARAVTRRYPGTLALNRVSMRLMRSRVNVLIGENGAGKSTLMRILAGVETADSGELLLEGSPVRIRSPREAAALGIAIVHQELSILPNLDISENVFAGRELTRAGVLLDRPAEDRRAREALTRLRNPMPVRAQTARLSLGSRQLVEIARALDQGARILILDEPTSALSSAETESLFRVIADLKRAGVSIVYISHRLHELLHLGDWFTVLRSGRVVGEAARGEVTRQWIVERMSGRAACETAERSSSAEASPILLSVRGLTIAAAGTDEAAQAPLNDVTLTLQRGEILGIYGLLGAGRTELLESLAGVRRMLGGAVMLNGVAIRVSEVADAVRHGIILVPEDRQRDGLIPEMSIRENIAIGAMRGMMLSRTQQLAQARRLMQELNIAAGDLELPVTSLSGGNQQKVLIARCLLRNPSLLLLDEPTRGVDVGAKAEIYAILRRLAAQGIGILFTSSEIEETRTLADRALVLCQGRVSAVLAGSEMTDEALFAAASPVVPNAATTHPGEAFA